MRVLRFGYTALSLLVTGCGTRTELSLGPTIDADVDTANTPGPSCAPEDATGFGACFALLGYRWDGTRCVAVGGCGCTGTACKELAETLEACEAAHASCR